MRRPSACSTCRARRRKCNYPTVRDATVCEYCLKKGLRCIQGPPEGGYYAQRQAKQEGASSHRGELNSLQNTENVPDPQSQARTTKLPPIPHRLELVGLYFDYIHDQFHSMFHRPSFTQDVANDRIPSIILFAMFALSSRFSDDPTYAETDPRDRGEGCRVAAESLVNIRAVTPTTVQACVLLGAYAAASGDTDVENLYYGLAGRMCLALDLPNRPVANLLERELNIRVWWTICMVDVWSSTAVRLAPIMPMNSDVPLPIDEIPFSSMSVDFTSSFINNPPTHETPLLAEMIKLNRLLAKIVDFNSRCVVEHLEGEALEQPVQALSREMQHWLDTLPPHMRDTPENFQWFASQGLGRFFVAVYLGYYHYGQLLNYQFLGAEASTATSAYAEDCKHHAIGLCELVYRSFATPGSEALYSAVSHILVIASTVQIHTLLSSGDERQIRKAKSRLERNFEILLQLRSYWPSVDSAMSRLRAFHQTCLRSNETSFVLDRWLLRFLVQFAPHMELEPRENDPDYAALLALSKQSPLSTHSGVY
ncbi:C6 transcription factor-like protein [Periconia macrospinosa]|uniref:C6 transcription factor-like protein n=1 Tax=Periconia macrospinosa TaxID=97972 RepID=A0A2V1DQ87_9PLEO|nr:C6 transcription factor-like protein [Periconia macrospinosa]